MPKCAYCGVVVPRREREHVIPACLYPASKAKSKIQRLTVPTCRECNGGWSNDEAHFRNLLMISGEPNELVRELWGTKVQRSFHKADGWSRVSALFEQMVPVEIDGESRHNVYPAKDERFMRIIRKIIRGLCYHHKLGAPVPDHAVTADVLRYAVPKEVIDEMPLYHRERDVFMYQFAEIENNGLTSGWLLTFFGNKRFIGGVRQFLSPGVI